jgi:hypothetical protein
VLFDIEARQLWDNAVTDFQGVFDGLLRRYRDGIQALKVVIVSGLDHPQVIGSHVPAHDLE